MNLPIRFLISATLAAAIPLVFPGQGKAADMKAIHRAAKKEGSVVWYSWLKKKVNQKVAKAWKKKYPGVKLVHTRKSTSKQIPAIEAERLAGRVRVDVMNNTNPQSFLRWKREGFLAAFKAPNDAFLNPADVDPEGYYRTVAALLRPGLYNTKKVKASDVPKSYKELMTRKWKDKLVSSTPRKSGGDFIKYYLLAKTLGFDFIRALSKNNMLQVKGQGTVIRLVIKGERPMADGTSSHRIYSAIKKGAPIKPIYWAEGTVMLYGRLAMTKKGSHPNAAKLLIDLLISKKAQKILVKRFMYSARNDVGKPKRGPALSEVKILRATDRELIKEGRMNFADKFDAAFGMK